MSRRIRSLLLLMMVVAILAMTLKAEPVFADTIPPLPTIPAVEAARVEVQAETARVKVSGYFPGPDWGKPRSDYAPFCPGPKKNLENVTTDLVVQAKGSPNSLLQQAVKASIVARMTDAFARGKLSPFVDGVIRYDGFDDTWDPNLWPCTCPFYEVFTPKDWSVVAADAQAVFDKVWKAMWSPRQVIPWGSYGRELADYLRTLHPYPTPVPGKPTWTPVPTRTPVPPTPLPGTPTATVVVPTPTMTATPKPTSTPPPGSTPGLAFLPYNFWFSLIFLVFFAAACLMVATPFGGKWGTFIGAILMLFLGYVALTMMLGPSWASRWVDAFDWMRRMLGGG